MANGHGGPRQGMPGANYGQRTDLSVNRAPTTTAPPAPAPSMPVGPQRPALGPDDTPNLFDEGNPAVPMTAGLPTGPGVGAPVPAKDDLEIIKRYLPDMKAAAAADDAPVTFKALVRYLSGGQ